MLLGLSKWKKKNKPAKKINLLICKSLIQDLWKNIVGCASQEVMLCSATVSNITKCEPLLSPSLKKILSPEKNSLLLLNLNQSRCQLWVGAKHLLRSIDREYWKVGISRDPLMCWWGMAETILIHSLRKIRCMDQLNMVKDLWLVFLHLNAPKCMSSKEEEMIRY